MKKQLAAIVIPIYKPSLTEVELLSLKQCLKVLGNYTIVMISPVSLDMTGYEQLLEQVNKWEVVRFDDRYFDGISGYNQLMLSSNFYKTFLQYEFMLIYQLDAYVFKDELSYWCGLGYDYIGAPYPAHVNAEGQLQMYRRYAKVVSWFNRCFHTDHRISPVGNGGFSLRKVRSAYWMLRLLPSKVKHWGTNNEDGFFNYWGNLFYPFFKLAPEKLAERFSLETTPSAAFKKGGNVLPFGCHAFEKYEPEFWEPYIK